jgi:medium-chain acyl-[acyl-carrier-protein] hydrolase
MRRSMESRWVACPIPRPDATSKLVCFPSAGSGIAPFASWARRLPEHVEACLVRLPGRETRIREAPYRNLNRLVDDLAPEIEMHLDKPAAFFGHSMGAAIAYELVRRFREQGRSHAARLIVSARRAPQLEDPDPPMHVLSDADLVAELRRRYDGIPSAILETPELLEVFLPTLRADCELLETYHWQAVPRLDVPVAAFGGSGDRRVGEQDLAAWSEQTSQEFRLRMFPGGHFYVHSDADLVLQALVHELGEPT